jgi:1,2-diacylglycerol 3-alpha-glucosyltransferase
MNIAFFSDTYLPNRDGVVVSMRTTRNELEKLGHRVFIFCSGSRKAKRENRDRRVFYHTSVPFRPYPDYKLAVFPFFSSYKMKKLGIDIVHSHGMASMGLAAVSAAQKENLPSIATFHTMIPKAVHYVSKREMVKRFMGSVAWRYLRWYYGLFDEVTCPSNHTREVLEEHGIPSIVVPNGVDTKRFNPCIDPAPFRETFNIKGRKIVLHAGRLVIEKNIDLLIDSALLIKEEVPNVLFLIVGDGPAKEHYKERVMAEHLEKDFLFTGFVPDGLLPFAYASCDVLAFPSLFDTQGLVALEGMACGKPVAAAKGSASEDIVKNGLNGYLFENNPDDCADKIVKTIKRAKALGPNARKSSLLFSKERCTKRLVGAYERLL